MKFLSISATLCSFMMVSCLSAKPVSSNTKNDLNGDGLADKIELAEARLDEDGFLKSKRVQIVLSNTAKMIRAVIETSTGNLSLYQGVNFNEIVVDFSNRSSRDSAELSYLIYRWDEQQQNFCLKASVTGIPTNQLKSEIVPSQIEVTRYGGCTGLGSGLPKHSLSHQEAASLAFSELSTIQKGTQIPEYLAFELADLVDASNVAEINNVGYYQEQQNFLAPALIVLRSVHSRFPKRIVATLNLADTYWKLGKNEKACSLYKTYLNSVKKNHSKVIERVKERAVCQ